MNRRISSRTSSRSLRRIALFSLALLLAIGAGAAPSPQANAAPAGCLLGERKEIFGERVGTGAWTYPYAANIGNFRAHRASTSFINTGDTPLYDVKATLPYLYLYTGTRYRPAHWVEDRGIFLTTPTVEASPNGALNGMDSADLGFTGYIAEASSYPAGTLSPWSRQRVGDIPMSSLNVAYHNASFPTSLSINDTIPTWDLGDISPSGSTPMVFQVMFERQANGATLGWTMPEVHASAFVGCTPALSPSTTTIQLPTAAPIAAAASTTIDDFDTTNFEGGTLTLNASSLAAGETAQFGIIGDRVSIDGSDVLLDGNAIGTLVIDGSTFAITFTSNITPEHVEAIIQSIGVTGVTTTGERALTLTITDPQGNASTPVTLHVIITSTPDTSTIDNNEAVNPLAPDTGIGLTHKNLGLSIIAMLGLMALTTVGVRLLLRQRRH